MKYIIAGTNRPQSRTKLVALQMQKYFKDAGEEVEIIDLAHLPWGQIDGSQYGGVDRSPAEMRSAIEKLNTAEGILFVVPEYNGSMPGALKYFIDHWKYPETFEHRPVAYIGLGGMFGGLRPVEHLMQVMSYRNAFNFPIRVFMMNVWNLIKGTEIEDPTLVKLMRDQVQGFQKFCLALKQVKLDANSLNQKRPVSKTP
jgi:NAD(P)H-dependent FMN reductase